MNEVVQEESKPRTWATWVAAFMDAIGRFIVGGIVWVAFILVAMLAGFSGISSAQGWFGLAWILGAAVAVWAFLPIFEVLRKR